MPTPEKTERREMIISNSSTRSLARQADAKDRFRFAECRRSEKSSVRKDWLAGSKFGALLPISEAARLRLKSRLRRGSLRSPLRTTHQNRFLANARPDAVFR